MQQHLLLSCLLEENIVFVGLSLSLYEGALDISISEMLCNVTTINWRSISARGPAKGFGFCTVCPYMLAIVQHSLTAFRVIVTKLIY